jgi:hypothetical protein
MANPTAACAVCGKPVSLEDCKVDERGDSVHEECYLARVGSATELNERLSSSRKVPSLK